MRTVAAILFSCAAVPCLLQPLHAASPDKSGVKPTSLSLPSGPGSIEGLGESFEPQLNTGTFTYRLPLKLPPVRGGAPDLALEYNSGHGNGPLGLGWRLSLPCLQRQTDKGLPLYAETDTFVDWTGEELVHLADDSYRQENEFAFTRYSRTPEGGWRAQRRNGVTLLLGQSALSRLDSPEGGTFSWHLESSEDPNGNRAEYRWRHDQQQIYLDEVRYGLHATEPSAFFRLAFHYDDRRPDPIVDYRPRFRCETRLRLTGVTVFLGDRRIRHWQLAYHTNTPVSLLASVTMFGDERSRTDDTAVANEDFLPPTFFDYSRSLIGDGWQMQTNDLGFTADLNAGEAELVDVNFDGLPDILLDDTSEGYLTALNRGAPNPWGPLRRIANAPSGDSTRLKAGSSWLADLRGEGRSALLLWDTAGHYFRRFNSPTEFGEPIPFPIEDGHFPLADPNVRLVDLNFDKATDLLATDGDSLSVLINGQFSPLPAARTNRIRLGLPAPVAGLRFSDGWQLADMNGDRLQDLVLPGLADEAGTQVCLSRGWGVFEPPFAITNGPGRNDLGSRGPQGLSLNDLDQDGLADLVYVDSGDVRIWRQEPGDRWGRPILIQDAAIPNFDAETTAVRFADLNGNGSTDIVWFEPNSTTVRWLELNPRDKPWLLNRVTTTLGRSLDIAYRVSTDFMVEAMNTTNAWTSVAPFPLPVVAQIIEGDGLGNRYTNLFTYRNAHYDGDEREFHGFESAERRELGDAGQGAPTLVTRFQFDTGARVEALKGQPLTVEARDEAGALFHRVTNGWTARVLPTWPAPGELRVNTFAFQGRRTTEIRERGPAEAAVWLEEGFDYDDFGNEVRHTDWGRLDPGDPPWDDERVTVRTFSAASPSGQSLWLLDRLVTEELQDETGAVITRAHSFYDDETFTGENLGVVTRGNLTLVREWVQPGSTNAVEAARYRLATRNLYDPFGNVTVTFDPLAVPDRPQLGHQRRVQFDATLHTYPVREIVYTANPLEVAAGEPVPRLELSADYDLGLGVLRRATDFNGNATAFEYDTFGRLAAITKPGDTPDRPTSAFRYRLVDPRANGGTVNWIETRHRELAGAAGTFDTRAYFDGLGRKLMTRTESERPGEVVVTGATEFNQRRAAWKSLLPYFEPGTLEFQPAVLANAVTETHYDALRRPTHVIQPPTSADGHRAFARTTYGPLTKLVEDEEQTRPASPRTGAAMRYTDDGLRDREGEGRLRRVEEIVKLDDEGRPAADPRVWVTTYRYDLLDNFTGYTDSQGNQKEFQFDALSRKTFMNDPDRGVMSWTYDDASNVVESRDAKAQVIRYTYDGVNRRLTEDYLDEALPNVTAGLAFDPARPVSADNRPDVAYFYDLPVPGLDLGNATTDTARNARGMLATVWDLAGEEHTSYDARGRIAWIVKRIPQPPAGSTFQRFNPSTPLVSYRTAFAYDSLDRLTQLTYPDDDVVCQAYNSRSLLDRVHGGQVIAALGTSNVIAGLTYRASAQPATIRYGNGVETAYDYDSRLRLTSLLTRHASRITEPLIHFTYAFDDASNIERIEDHRPLTAIPAGDPRRNTQHFRYDDLYRLTEARYGFGAPDDLERDDGRIHYRYDRIGNMLEQTSTLDHQEKGLPVANLGEMDSGGTLGRWNRTGRAAADPPGPHALTRIRDPRPQTPDRIFPYDSNGNMTTMDGLACTWDFKDRLITVENAEMRADYAYDYTDRRITKQVAYKPGSDAFTPHASRVTTTYINKYFEVRDHAEPVKYVWNGETRVARVTASLSPTERVQRLHLSPGLNLISPAVGLTNALGQLAGGVGGVGRLELAYRWDASSGQWEAVRYGDVLSAGSVLWIGVSANATLTLAGRYAESQNPLLAPGANFVGGWGLHPLQLSDALPATVVGWTYEARSFEWRPRTVRDIATSTTFSRALEPGTAFLARLARPTTLNLPGPASQVRFYHQDHLDSTCALTDGAGKVLEGVANFPFGQPRLLRRVLELVEPYGFSQKERDAETRLHYFELRLARMDLARFLSADPLLLATPPLFRKLPQSLSPYCYALNAPLIHRDPDGTHPVLVFAAAVALGIASTPQYANAPAPGEPGKHVSPAKQTAGIVIDVASAAPGAIRTGMQAAAETIAAPVAGKVTTAARSAFMKVANQTAGWLGGLPSPVGQAAKSELITLGNKAAPLAGQIGSTMTKAAAEQGAKETAKTGLASVLGESAAEQAATSPALISPPGYKPDLEDFRQGNVVIPR